MLAVNSTAQGLLDSVNLSPSAWDYIFVLLLIGLSFLYGLSLGRNRIIVINLGAFFGYVLVSSVPWKLFSSLTGREPSASFQIFLLAALIIAIFFLLPKSSLTSALRLKKRGKASWWQLLFFGVGQVGLLAAMIGSFLETETVSGLNPLIQKYVFGQEGFFGWVLFNLLLMFLLKKKKSDGD